ncbi:MAG: response regulator transcription factor [Bryobacterales bacterium]|nr:response regulator transcription factor [Bryobacterales bacterium]
MRLLIVEDEPEAARLLADGLREMAYAVDVAYDGVTAIEKAYCNSYDLIILDLMLPGKDGYAVCRELRATGNTLPVLMLTAQDQVDKKIRGLDSGADDYLTKPFDLGELGARVRALLRRGPALRDPILRVADLELDTRRRSARRAGRAIELTAKEYALLEFLVRQHGQVVGRAEISEHVWDERFDPFSKVIEVYIQRLRRKVDSGGTVPLIHTRRGEGYLLDDRGDADA